MSRVAVNETNLRHCRCVACKVQEKSACTQKILNSNPAPEEKNLGKLYCAKGKSDCPDLNTRETCICSSCLVWDENNLNSMYYCLYGDANGK